MNVNAGGSNSSPGGRGGSLVGLGTLRTNSTKPGDGFEGEVQRALAQIATYPESAPLYAGKFRRILVRRFEHGIFYRVYGQRIVITAMLGLRQSRETIKR